MRADSLPLATLALVIAAMCAACGGKARAQTEPPLPQPTPNRTVDAVVRGLVTVTMPAAATTRATTGLAAQPTAARSSANEQAPARPTLTVAVTSGPTRVPTTDASITGPTRTSTSTTVERQIAVPTATKAGPAAGVAAQSAPPTKPSVPTPDNHAVALTPMTGATITASVLQR